MGKLIVLIFVICILNVQSARIKDVKLNRIARSPHFGLDFDDDCDEPHHRLHPRHGPPPPLGPPPPPVVYHTQNWSGVAKGLGGTTQGVFSGAAASAGSVVPADNEAYSLVASGVAPSTSSEVEGGTSSYSSHSSSSGSKGQYGVGSTGQYNENLADYNSESAQRSINTGFSSKSLVSESRGQSSNGFQGSNAGQSGSGDLGSQLGQYDAQSSAANSQSYGGGEAGSGTQFGQYGAGSSGLSGGQASFNSQSGQYSAGLSGSKGGALGFNGQSDQYGAGSAGFNSKSSKTGSAEFNIHSQHHGPALGNANQPGLDNQGGGFRDYHARGHSDGHSFSKSNKDVFFEENRGSKRFDSQGQGTGQQSYVNGPNPSGGFSSSKSSTYSNNGNNELGSASGSQAGYSSTQGQIERFQKLKGSGHHGRGLSESGTSGNGYIQNYETSNNNGDANVGSLGSTSDTNQGYPSTGNGGSGQEDLQSTFGGALNLASQGLQTAQKTPCSTCDKSNYALSNAKSRSGSAVALSIGG